MKAEIPQDHGTQDLRVEIAVEELSALVEPPTLDALKGQTFRVSTGGKTELLTVLDVEALPRGRATLTLGP